MCSVELKDRYSTEMHKQEQKQQHLSYQTKKIFFFSLWTEEPIAKKVFCLAFHFPQRTKQSRVKSSFIPSEPFVQNNQFIV